MLFEVAVAIKPCIIIFDEMEDLCGKRDGNSDNSQLSMKTTLLSELQDIKRDPEIHFIGTTNRVGKYQHITNQILLHICLGINSVLFTDALDAAFVRRIEFCIYVGLPTQYEIVCLLKRELSLFSNSLSDKEVKKIAKIADGAAHSFIKTLVMKAHFHCKDGQKSFGQHNRRTGEKVPTIKFGDIKKILKDADTKRNGPYDARRFRDWKTNLGPSSLICELFPE
jgi:SpoVK/Ycf46/Vps4 family AAA+-type ATPase